MVKQLLYPTKIFTGRICTLSYAWRIRGKESVPEASWVAIAPCIIVSALNSVISTSHIQYLPAPPLVLLASDAITLILDLLPALPTILEHEIRVTNLDSEETYMRKYLLEALRNPGFTQSITHPSSSLFVNFGLSFTNFPADESHILRSSRICSLSPSIQPYNANISSLTPPFKKQSCQRAAKSR